MMAKTKAPWLMTNLLHKESGRPMADCLLSYVIDKNGFKFGFVGFADKEWFDILPPDIPIDEYEFIDYNESLRKHSKELHDAGCDFVFALNHMRLPEDLAMAAANDASVVDVEFGGHDHCYHRSLNAETNVFVQKSGTDFECFTNLTMLLDVEQKDHERFKQWVEINALSDLEVFYSKKLRRMFISERINITGHFAKDAELERHVQHYVG